MTMTEARLWRTGALSCPRALSAARHHRQLAAAVWCLLIANMPGTTLAQTEVTPDWAAILGGGGQGLEELFRPRDIRLSLDTADEHEASTTLDTEKVWRLPNGERVHTFAIHADAGVIVGAGAKIDEVVIQSTSENQHIPQITVNFIDAKGQIVPLEESEIGVFDLEQWPLTFELKPFEETDLQLHVALLLDRSGSMSSVAGTVTRAAATFMEALPSNARCKVTSFASSTFQHSRTFTPCAPGMHDLARKSVGGGTRIYDALIETYGDIVVQPGSGKIVIILSDGVGSSEHTVDDVKQKKSAPTFVYWLGNADHRALTPIADRVFHPKGDIEASLRGYLSTIANAIQGQQVIDITGKF